MWRNINIYINMYVGIFIYIYIYIIWNTFSAWWFNYSERNRFSSPFKVNGIWSWWQFLYSTEENCHHDHIPLIFAFFLLILNQIDFRFIRNRKENCFHDRIFFNLKGNGNLFFFPFELRLKLFLWSSERLPPFLLFSYSSHPTPLTNLDLWEGPRLASEF